MIGILLISTRKYKQFVQSLVHQIDEYFLKGHDKTIFLFTDEVQQVESKSNVEQISIPPYKFPAATLYRFKCFRNHQDVLKHCEYLFYMDVDMAVVSPVGEEILSNGITVVRHPGFFTNGGWGDSNNPMRSTSYLPKEMRGPYVAGGFNGGLSFPFLNMCCKLADDIDIDDANGIIAEHNDETHLNGYISKNTKWPINLLTPQYCMVEQMHLREAWGISDLPVSIIALNKNHEEIRS